MSWEKLLKTFPPQQRICALLIIVCALIVTGVNSCALIGTPVAEKLAGLVTTYCENEPYSARSVYRNSVNAVLEPSGHSVEVTCSGDPE